jgi:hypothetical protein
VPVTGLEATGSAGSVTVTTDAGVDVPVTGVEATGSVGSVTVTGDANISVTGIEATASVGTYQQTYYLDGSTGAVTDSDAAWTDDANYVDGSIATGASCSTVGSQSSNALWARGSAAGSNGPVIDYVELRFYGSSSVGGQVSVESWYPGATEYLGVVSQTSDTPGWTGYTTLSTPVTGGNGWIWGIVKQMECYAYVVSGSGTVNKLEERVNIAPAVIDVDVAVTGEEAAGSVGSVTATGDANVAVTGEEATGSAGSVTVTSVGNVPVTGEEATASVGSVSVSVDSTNVVTGLEATGAAGTVSVSVDMAVSVTGVTATGLVGSVIATGISNAIDVPVTGVQATGYVGNLALVLAPHVPNQDPSWEEIKPHGDSISGVYSCR